MIEENPQSKYWNERFAKEGKIWGEAPCMVAKEAARIFKNHCISRILVPGCGYGRNSLFFARKGFQVAGFDISSISIQLAKQEAIKEKINIHYFVANILNSPFNGITFEGIFSFNTLHLFPQNDRMKIRTWLAQSLMPNGILVLTSMSTRDDDFGKGEKVAPNTFEIKKGRPLYYSSEEDMRSLFGMQFQIENLREIQEEENHGGKPHFHWMWFLVGKEKQKTQ